MNHCRQIKAISFDGDMTLWDFQKVMRHSLAITLAELRRRVPRQAASDLTIDKMIEIRNAVAAELKGKVANLRKSVSTHSGGPLNSSAVPTMSSRLT